MGSARTDSFKKFQREELTVRPTEWNQIKPTSFLIGQFIEASFSIIVNSFIEACKKCLFKHPNNKQSKMLKSTGRSYTYL